MTKDDFTVLDDGQVQTVTGFEGRELQTAPIPAASTMRVPVSTNTRSAASPGRVTAFVIDDLGLDPVRGGGDAKRALTRWLEEKADPRDEVTLVTTSGDVWWSDSVGRGRSDLLAVLERVSGKRPLTSPSESMTEWEAHQILEGGPEPPPNARHLARVVARWFSSGACLRDSRAGASVERSCRAQVFLRAQQLENLTLRRQRIVLGTIERLGEAFAGRRGRKAVFVVSESLIPDTPPRAVRQGIAAAQQANMAVYFLDARGLVGQSFYSAESPTAMPDASELAEIRLEETVTATAAGDELAEATGGRLIGSTNDLFGGLSRAADEGSAYYLLGYPTQGPPDDRWHKLEVRVNRPGLTVRARQGYLARVPKPEKDSVEKERADARPPLAFGPDQAGVPLRLVCRTLGEAAGGLRVLVGVAVGTAGLTFATDPAGASPLATAAAFDLTLLSIGRSRPLREDFEQRVTLRSGGTTHAPWWTLAREVVLPPGATQVRASVRDVASGRAGLVSYRLDVPETVAAPPRDFEHSAAAFAFEQRGDKRQTAILAEVADVRTVTTEEDDEGEGDLVVIVRITDAAGQTVERLTETLAGAGPLRWRGSAALAPGDYTLETVLLDLTTGALSVGRQPLHVAASEGVTVSSLAIVTEGVAAESGSDTDPFRVGELSFWPLLEAKVDRATPKLRLLFHTYPAGDAPLELALAVWQDAERIVESPLTPPASDARGRVSWMGAIPLAALPPGPYTVAARAREGTHTTEERLTFEIRAAPETPRLVEPDRATNATLEPELAALLLKAGQYVANYTLTFRDIVAEETYEQRAAPCAVVGESSRNTRADVAFVALGGAFPWGAFRDVFEVDGQPVRDREERLERLFREDRTSALSRARAIRNESARYNIGIERTVNEPTLPLAFLQPGNQARFEFRKGGREEVAGHTSVIVSFREKQRPTLVGTLYDRASANLPAKGRFWIDPENGLVLRCEVLFRMPKGSLARLEIDYRPETGLDIWVPAEMREYYGSNAPDEVCPAGVQARARYAAFRRFSVETQETIHYRDVKPETR